ncbi:SEC-C metal-binding domain-containing protein [Paenibacillus sp. 11B]|uniref:YecA family protein n=1 Tax=Paenibacillus sp. 11B TaxID=3060965 RepID=UPI00264FAC14|nr:SEC-C metal-binding domain-containing protein [Paenibacillus sp. 11B]MDN8593174.1 SEC-C metal-binding domain-containing protein [Paenibacillus sp. 11B]
MLGRNDICLCSSGKKYKKCHGNDEVYNKEILNIPFEHPLKKVICDTYVAINEDFRRNPNPGSCHITSSVMYILLQEQNVECEACIGEVEVPGLGYFDHSWIEIDGAPFDIAIQLTLDEKRHSRVYAGHDLNDCSIDPSMVNYRFSKDGLDNRVAGEIYRTPLTNYLDDATDQRGWETIERIASKLGMDISRNVLREKYKHTGRKLIEV